MEIEPRDPVRASKCFQKAFELDSRQSEAARRLAESFASDQAWDLVDFVARRTIEGDLQGSLGDQSLDVSGLQSINPWAWNAVGVVELVCT
jgi:superkiller protein 3